MKRRLQILALCAAALMAVRMMAQDNGATGAAGDTGGPAAMGSGDAGGGSGADNSGASGANPSGASGSTDQGATGEGSLPSGSQGTQGTQGGGTDTTQPGAGLFGPGTGTETPGTGAPAITPAPSPGLAPGLPFPGVTPAPSPSPPALNAGTLGTTQPAPVTFNLPSAYGGAVPQSFTLGQGRLARPPMTFSLSVTEGYNDNIYSADSHPSPTPRVAEPTPPLEERLIGFRISPPGPPTPIFQSFRPKISEPTSRGATSLGVVGSPTTSASLGVQIQQGSPRTVLILDASLGYQDTWNEGKNGQTSYTGAFDMALQQRLTPRASVSVEANAVYQDTPNFTLQNAPTSSNTQPGGSNYLNGSGKIDLSYAWSSRVSTVTSYSLSLNLLESSTGNNLYESTYGTQFRYSVSARNTLTAEIRETSGIYPTNSSLNSNSTAYLVGLDSFISSKLRNTVSLGVEATSGNGSAGLVPYLESATSLTLPHGAGLSWTNQYGTQESGALGQSTKSFRTMLSYQRPFSAKLSASLSLAYNYVVNTDSVTLSNSSTQQQFQLSILLGYQASPRLSFSLSYSYLDLLSSQLGESYQIDEVSLGGSYIFQ